ncbi:MAG: TIGR03545 family protein [candidate division KSB1 bacterium]|nr:TIGR03545 family protein [candidate division KSB1 bacterium]
MRWKGILFLAVLAALFIVLSLIFTDLWLERRLENLGSSLVGAKVEIDNLDFSFIGLHLKWDSLQVANPKQTMKNILTTGRTEFDLDLMPLLQKKIVIENLQVTSVTSGTDRTTDGKIPKKPRPEKEQKPNLITKTIDRLARQVAEAPAWNLDDLGKKVNVDSLIKFLDIRSPQKIDSLYQATKTRYDYWDSLFSSIKVKQELNDFETRLTALRPNEIRSLEDLEAALQTVRRIKTKVDSLEKFVADTRAGLKSDLDLSFQGVSLADDWVKEDYRRALEKARLPEISKENMARFLFGDQVVNDAVRALATVNTVRSYAEMFRSDKPKKEKPPRLKGQTIHFVEEKRYPRFWIKNVRLSGHTTRGFRIEGGVTDITPQQPLVGRPTVLKIAAERRDGANLAFWGELNYLSTPRETFRLELNSMPLQNVTLSNLRLLPQRIAQGSGRLNLDLQLTEDRIQGELYFIAEKLRFAFAEEATKRHEQILRRVIDAADLLDLSVSLLSDEGKTSLRLNSNLDDFLARELRAVLSEEIDKAKAKIEAYLASQIDRHKQQLDKLVQTKSAALGMEIGSLEELLKNPKKLLDEKQKELERRIEEEKKKGAKRLEDEVKKRLPGVGR